MSYGWFWTCNDCFPQENFLTELWRVKSPQQLVDKNVLEEAYPYYHLEVLSNRAVEQRRCRKCDRWHISSKDSKWNEKQCPSLIPFEIPLCEKCGTRKRLLFCETDSVVFVRSAFCHPEGPPYFSGDEVFDPYFYTALRHEHHHVGERVLSAVYFMGKNAKRYGRYAPYFYIDEFRLDEFNKWLEVEWQDTPSNGHV